MKEKKTKEPKGYAYVTLADHRLVDKILDLPHVIEGRRVDCQLASRKGEKKLWKDEQKTRRVFVTNLPLSVDGEQLNSMFSSYGPIRNAYVISDYETRESKGYGYVEFLDPQHALKVLETFRDSLDDPSKIHCLPYLGRHEQKSQGWNQQSQSPESVDANEDLKDTRSNQDGSSKFPFTKLAILNEETVNDHSSNNCLAGFREDGATCKITTTHCRDWKFILQGYREPSPSNLRFNVGVESPWQNCEAYKIPSLRDSAAKWLALKSRKSSNQTKFRLFF